MTEEITSYQTSANCGRLDYMRIGGAVPSPETWKRLIEEWHSVMDDYAVRSRNMNKWASDRGGDLAYWHKQEITNVGFLAGAVWRLGGVVIHEFEVTRARGQLGWGDLWIDLDGFRFHVEAKGCNPATASGDAVEQALGVAREQLKVPVDEIAEFGVALCFVAPAVVGSAFDFRQLVKRFERENTVTAIYLPGKALNLQYEGYCYPGVALIAEIEQTVT